jgi:hypothetical protein
VTAVVPGVENGAGNAGVPACVQNPACISLISQREARGVRVSLAFFFFAGIDFAPGVGYARDTFADRLRDDYWGGHHAMDSTRF